MVIGYKEGIKLGVEVVVGAVVVVGVAATVLIALATLSTLVILTSNVTEEALEEIEIRRDIIKGC